MPLLIILRDILKIAQNRKEVKKALHQKNILLNKQLVRDEKNAVLLFDTISIIPSKKHYKLTLSEKGRFHVKEIKESEANAKIAKVINKKTLKGKKTQLNLSDGRNFLSEIKCSTNDSLLINLDKKKVEKCLPLKEKSKVIIFRGQHSGAGGIIKKIDKDKKIVEVEVNDKQINVLIKQLMVIE